jgi:hypothetical protein
MFKEPLRAAIRAVRDFLIEIYYAELDHIDDFYGQYR